MYNQLDESTRTWGMACHLSALAGFVIPFGSIVVPLIIWLTQKNKHPFIDEQGKESVNFQISLIIYILAFSLLLLIIGVLLAVFSTDVFPYFFFLIIPLQIFVVLILLFEIVMVIFAGVRAYNGESYHYPFNLKLLR